MHHLTYFRCGRGRAFFYPAILLAGLVAIGTPIARADSTSPDSDIAAAAASVPAPSGSKSSDIEDAIEHSVVRVLSTVSYPDFFKPWTKMSPRDISGTGIVIEGNRILTNAHVVLYASQVQVQANQDGDKISATVEAVAPGIDLAVLKLDDASFFKTHLPLQRASALPQIRDAVLVYGFPTGGNGLSITKGIVSRIDFVPYGHYVSGLRVQIDAAINPGNSGGPAMVGNKVIGLAFSRLTNAQNIGYIIPCEEIDLFLKDIADGHYDGKPTMFDDLQTLENPVLRRFLKLDKKVTGIIVTKPAETDSGYPLKKWDVITRIGDTPVDDQGMIKVNDSVRIRFQYLIQKIAKNGKVPLTVIRAGKEIAVALPVASDRPELIRDIQGDYPSYFVYGPLVFSTATAQMISVVDSASAQTKHNLAELWSIFGSPLVTRRSSPPAFPGESLVIVASSPFPHKLSKGYSNPILKVVKAVNGIPIKNLNHLVEVLRDSKDPFIVIEFAGRGSETIVFPRAETVAATDGILADNGVRSQGSPDTLAIWNAKPPAAK